MAGVKLPDYTALGAAPTPTAPSTVATYTAGGPQAAQAEQYAAVAKEGSDLKDLYDKSSINDAYMQFSNKMRDAATQYYSLSGNDAVKGLPVFQQKVADLKEQAGKGVLGTEAVTKLQDMINYTSDRHLYGAALHADDQGKKFASSTHAAMLSNFADDAADNYADPKAVALNQQKGATEISSYSAKTGQSPEVTDMETRKFNSDIDTKVTQAKIDSISALPGAQQLAILRPLMQKMGTPVEGGKAAVLPTDSDAASSYLITKFEGEHLVANDGGKGASKYGIVGSQNGLTADQVSALTPEDAKSIYKKDYWDKIGADSLPDNMKYIAFDTAVNMGPETAKQMLSQANGDPEKMLQLRQAKYDALTKNNPAKYGSYADGWQSRQDSLAQSVGAPLTSPQAALASGLAPKDISSMYRKAVTQANEESIVSRADVTNRYNDNVASIAATGKQAVPLTTQEINDAFVGEPAKAEQYIKNLNWQKNFYDARTGMALTSPAQDAEMLKGNMPSGTGFADQAEMHDALTKAYAQKQKQISDDPVQYIRQNSTNTEELFQEAMKDPSKFQQYATSVDQMQAQLGVQPWDRHVLSNDHASNLVNTLMTMPADKRGEEISKMASSYGNAWPQVMHDMVGQKLPAAYEVLAAVDNPVARNALSEALASGKNARAAIPGEDAKDIDRAIDNDSDLTALAKSGSDLSGSINKIAEIKESVKMMAYYLSTTMGPKQAVQTAVASVTTDKYDFMDDNARVPKGTHDDMENYGNKVLRDLNPADLRQLSIPGAQKKSDDFMQIVTPKDGVGVSETWPAGEPGTKDNPRPDSIPLNKNGVQIFKPDQFGPKDLMGEKLHIDAGAQATISKFAETLSEDQITELKKQPDYTTGNGSNDQKMKAAVNAAARGYLVGQWPQDAVDNFFTSKQKDILDTIKLDQENQSNNMGFTPEKIQEITHKGMMDGRWATNEKVDGLVRLDTHGNPVMLKNGQRLEFKFNQVAKGFTNTLPTDQKANPSFLERLQQGFEGLAN